MGAVLDLVRVLFEPTAVFERVREKPRFLAPFLALAVITIAITALQLPYTKAALAAQFAQTPNMTPEQAQAGMKFAAVGIGVAPIAVGVFLVVNALILWVSTSVLGGEGKFATLLSVTTYASITSTDAGSARPVGSMIARTSTCPSIPACRSSGGYRTGGPDRNTGRSSTIDSVDTSPAPWACFNFFQ